MQIGRYVVIGTMHVRCATAQLLTEWALLPPVDQPLAVSVTQCGWFLPSARPGRVEQLPPELPAILALGRRHGCGFVLVDCDGPRCPDLPVFAW
jgi:hypothetical protein